MDIMTGLFLGVRIFIWLYFLMSIVCGVGVLIYWKREKIKETYYKVRWPEKVIKIVLHYPGNLYTEFWRLIPDKKEFSIAGKKYFYDDSEIIKANDFYIRQRNYNLVAIIDGAEYQLDDRYKLKKKRGSWPELHYFDNVPFALNYDGVAKTMNISSKEITELAEADLWTKLLTMNAEKGLMMFLMLIAGANLLITLFLMAKTMGWLK